MAVEKDIRFLVVLTAEEKFWIVTLKVKVCALKGLGRNVIDIQQLNKSLIKNMSKNKAAVFTRSTHSNTTRLHLVILCYAGLAKLREKFKIEMFCQ